MNGEALYSRYVKSLKVANDTGYHRNVTDLGAAGCERRKTFDSDNTSAIRPVAWPFLTEHDRQVWIDLAKRVTPNQRGARA